MKIQCEKCHQQLNKAIAKSFEEYQVGFVQCPECNKKNTRYISESDLLMYFACSATLYTLAVLIIYGLFTLLPMIGGWMLLVLFALLFTAMYFLSKSLSYYIYVAAPFKKGWQNKKLDENAEEIAKRMKLQFVLFLLVALMFGTQTNLIVYCVILLISFIVLVGIKIRLSLRNEKRELNIK